MAFEIREAGENDVQAILELLCEGFPRRPRSYWVAAINALRSRPQVASCPSMGFVLVIEGKVEGVILLLSSDMGEGPRSNLSSWYVRPDYRKYATFLFQRCLKFKGSTYLDLSPADHVLSIVKAFGFKPYTSGTYLLDAKSGWHRGGKVRAFSQGETTSLPHDIVASLEQHRQYGCTPIVIEDEQGVMPALFRPKHVKRVIPTAQFVWGEPERLLKNRGPLSRWLLSKGYPFAFIDAPLAASAHGVRLVSNKGVRYVKGPAPIAVGDLRETELAVFGP